MTTAAAVLTSGNGASPNGSGTPTPNGGNGGLPAAPATGWWDTVKDADTKSWLAGKNFPDAEKALISYRNLETLFGADKAGRTIMMPKDDADTDGWNALSKRLGVPDTADGYKLPMPEGVDDGFAKTAAGWFHKHGVRPAAANGIAADWNAWVAEQVKMGEAADKAESEKQMAALEKEWGNTYSEKRELAQRGFREFAKQFGLDDKAALERAESVLGAANLTRFFAGLGSLNAESSFAGADGKGGFGMSAGEAKAQIDQIRADRIAGKITDHQWRTEYEQKVMKLGQILSAQGG